MANWRWRWRGCGCRVLAELMHAGTKFVGTSCVMTISAEPSRIELVECCNVSEERAMIATVA